MVEIFISYAHEDRDLCDQLRRQLSPLEREKRVSIWTDEVISAGAEWSDEIRTALDRARLVLLLVSADFLASDFCYMKQMTRALERHREGTARVVPVILRPCEWRSTPLGKLKALPRDGRPVTQWPDADAALSDVVKGLGPVLTELSSVPDREIASGTAPVEDPRPPGAVVRPPSPAERDDRDPTRGVGWRRFRGALPTMSFEFDVFLSHNSRDKPAVRQLGEALRQRGLRVWLDEWELVPGRPWQEALEEIIATTQAAAVLVGRDGLGPWQEPEMRGCISEFVARKLPVIPVLLPGAPGEPELPIFLKQFTWVDLRDGITEEGLDRLVWGITGQKPVAAVPWYPNDEVRDLSQALEDAYRQQEELVTAGGDTTAIAGEILRLRRRLRNGGTLKAGDFLDDGRFKLIESIGRGGFATVWRAYDRKTREPVAVKVLHGQFAEDRTRRERFFRGARKMAQLQHPGIVRVIEAEREEGGYRFFVMEYVAGGDLRQAVVTGRLTQAQRLRILLEVGDALEFAHQNGVIHRDVKPANVLLDPAGRPKLTDFDLVRALDTTGGTHTEAMLGTFLYASPEAMQNPKEAEATADVYSLGMTAVFAIYGKELPIAVMRDAESIIDQLSCSSQVKKALGKAIDWDPERRFRSVAALCRGLHEDDLSDVTKEVSPPEEETDANGIVFVRIPAGTFTMGSADDDPLADDDEKPAHRVTLSEFWISKYPITNEQYRRLWPDRKKNEDENGDLPVTGVSWYDAKAFCERLGYRLPTEAEWEYAARAGTETPWSFGTDESEIGRYAWYAGNSGNRVHPVGTREPNPWGLSDMHGNVWEWVDDELTPYSPEPQTNPATPEDSRSSAVLRGGAYWDSPRVLRSADRGWVVPEFRVPDFGFRCVRGPRRQP